MTNGVLEKFRVLFTALPSKFNLLFLLPRNRYCGLCGKVLGLAITEDNGVYF